VNLATNAAHAIGSRAGQIEFRLEAVDVDAASAQSVEGLREGRWVRLSVADDGCGMGEATLHRIFDPFFTTKPLGEGSGLGLSVVHGIVRRHDAAIAVESLPGEGSTFHIYFPPAGVEAEAEAEEPVPEPGAPKGRGERILFVDDEPALVALGRRALQQLGFHVEAFSAPAEALRAFKDAPAEYDVVVTDLAMPGMSGLEFSKALLEIRGNLPIVLTSGFLPAEEEADVRKIGVREILRKPHSIQALGIAVRRVLGGT
jgi:CheY-like chemotaxis protein